MEFPFRFAPAYRLLGAPFGITPDTVGVVVRHDVLEARFGPWRVATALDNIVRATVTGPYSLHRTAGSARYSFGDREITFATNGDEGLCLAFRDAIAGIEPTGVVRHPTLTVTVADVAGLAEVVLARTDAVVVVPVSGHPTRRADAGGTVLGVVVGSPRRSGDGAQLP